MPALPGTLQAGSPVRQTAGQAAQFADRRNADRHHAGLGKDTSDLRQSRTASDGGQAALAVLLLQGRAATYAAAAASLVVLAGFAGVMGAGACAAVLAPATTAWMVALETANWRAITASDRPVACSAAILALSPAVVLAGRPST